MELFSSPIPGYIVASLGYENKSEAYEDIRKFFQGVDCTTYFCKEDHMWYIIEKKN